MRRAKQPPRAAVVWLAAVALLLGGAGAGPPYLYVDGAIPTFKPAMFGGAKRLMGCTAVKVAPRYLDGGKITNAEALRGSIAVIDRDPPEKTSNRVSFVDKARQVQAAGAVMAVMVNHKEENLRPGHPLSAADPGITMPVIGVPLSWGQKILSSRRVDLLWDIDDLPGDPAASSSCVATEEDEMVLLAHGLFSRATQLSVGKRYPEALNYFNRAHGIFPRHADAVNNAGVELGRNEQHAAALKAFNRAVSLEPSNRNYQANHRLATKNARDHRRIAESDDVWAPS